ATAQGAISHFFLRVARAWLEEESSSHARATRKKKCEITPGRGGNPGTDPHPKGRPMSYNHRDRRRPPPCISRSPPHNGELFVALLAPARWCLDHAGVVELERLLHGAALERPGLTGWRAGPDGGYALVAEADADLLALSL